MGELFAEYDIFGAFGMTILLTFFSAIGSLLLGTFIAILRISPVGLLQKVGAFYVNTVRNTPLTLIIIACNIVAIVNLGFNLRLGPRPQQHHLGDHRAVGLPRGVRLRVTAVASTRCRSARQRRPDPWN